MRPFMLAALALGLLASPAAAETTSIDDYGGEPASLPVIDASGDWSVLAYRASSGGGIRVATTTGARFRRFGRVPNSARAEQVMARVDARGRVVLAWTVNDRSEYIEEYRDSYYCCERVWVTTRTRGGRFARPRRVSSKGTPGQIVDLAVGGGRASVAWAGDRLRLAATRVGDRFPAGQVVRPDGAPSALSPTTFASVAAGELLLHDVESLGLPPRAVATLPGLDGSDDVSDIAISPRGRLAVGWIEHRDQPDGSSTQVVRVASSTPDGALGEPFVFPPTPREYAYHLRLDVNNAGAAVAAVLRTDYDVASITVARASAGVWRVDRRLRGLPSTSSYSPPTVTIGPDGRAAIVWADVPYGRPDNLFAVAGRADGPLRRITLAKRKRWINGDSITAAIRGTVLRVAYESNRSIAVARRRIR